MKAEQTTFNSSSLQVDRLDEVVTDQVEEVLNLPTSSVCQIAEDKFLPTICTLSLDDEKERSNCSTEQNDEMQSRTFKEAGNDVVELSNSSLDQLEMTGTDELNLNIN